MAFKSWQSYLQFRNAVTNGYRYMFDEETKAFLDEVLRSCKSRIITIEQGAIFWRSQLGSDNRPVFDDEGNEVGDEPCPHPVERMQPRRYAASEGRANPKGIPCLYLATTKETAMSEVRPWVGSDISVAQFKTTKPLSVVDCSANHSLNPFFFNAKRGFYEPDEDKREKAVWAHIDKAFSTPITQNENQAKYAPTQVIAELFKINGFDGVVYKSVLSDGFNIALFELDSAEILNCFLYEAKSIEIDFQETGNPYFVKQYKT